MRGRSTIGALPVLAALLGLTQLLPGVAVAGQDVSGTVKGYECGDNCYLTIATPDGEEVTGLCSAPECDAWNEAAEMPSDVVGRKVKVSVETGQQFDNEGTLMGEFPAFASIMFED